MTEPLANKTIFEMLIGVTPTMAIIYFFIALVVVVALWKFKKLRLESVSIYGFNFRLDKPPRDSDSDQSTPEIKPSQIIDGNTGSATDTEETEDSLITEMFFHAYIETNGQNLDELNRTYIKLKNLKSRTKSDEAIQKKWFELRIFLRDDVVPELLSITQFNQGWCFPYLRTYALTS